MSNWFPLDMAIGLFVLGVSFFVLGHSAVCALRGFLGRHSRVSGNQRYRLSCEQH
jgi:hypothetical protein